MANGKYQEWLEPEGLLKIEGWARDGLTDEQIAHNMCISNDECILQDEDANLKASDSWEELRKGCPLRKIPSKYAEKDFTPI